MLSVSVSRCERGEGILVPAVAKSLFWRAVGTTPMGFIERARAMMRDREWFLKML